MNGKDNFTYTLWKGNNLSNKNRLKFKRPFTINAEEMHLDVVGWKQTFLKNCHLVMTSEPVLAKYTCTSLTQLRCQWCDDALNTKIADECSNIVLSILLLWCRCQKNNKHLLCQSTLTDQYAQAISSVFVYWPWVHERHWNRAIRTPHCDFGTHHTAKQ